MGKLTPELARSFDFEGTKGILINDVEPEGPAAKNGVLVGDIVDQLDGAPIRDMAAFRNAIAQRRPGTEVQLRVWRSATSQTITVRLGALEPDSGSEARKGRDAKAPKRSKKTKKPSIFHGLVLEEPPPALRQRLGLEKSQGAMIREIARGSAAEGADLRVGDVIVSIEGRPVTSVAAARRKLERANLEEGLRVRVRRGRFGHFTVLRK
jgi:serine protease Do